MSKLGNKKKAQTLGSSDSNKFTQHVLPFAPMQTSVNASKDPIILESRMSNPDDKLDKYPDRVDIIEYDPPSTSGEQAF